MKPRNARSDSDWFYSLDSDVNYLIEQAKIDFAVRTEKLMDKESVSRSSLADRLKKSAAYITKLLRGEQNLTIASMVRIARALDCELHIHVAPKSHQVRWVERINGGCPTVGRVERPVIKNADELPVWARKHAA